MPLNTIFFLTNRNAAAAGSSGGRPATPNLNSSTKLKTTSSPLKAKSKPPMTRPPDADTILTPSPPSRSNSNSNSNRKQTSRIPLPKPSLPISSKKRSSEVSSAATSSSTSSPHPDSPSIRYGTPRPPPPPPPLPSAPSPSGPSQPRPTRSRALSRTQLRHASAARRLSAEGLGKNILPGPSNNCRPQDASRGFAGEGDVSLSGVRSTIKTALGSGQSAEGVSHLKRKGIDSAPDAYEEPPPYLCKSLKTAGVDLIANSSSMETLMGNRDLLGASYITPPAVLNEIYHEDIYYHVWVAAKLAKDEKPLREYDIKEVVSLAFDKFLVELGYALANCLRADLPHYTFVDVRKLMHKGGVQDVIDQAITVVRGLEKKGLARERIYVSIPATESALAAAKYLSEKHDIKTNMVLVSSVAQAAACAAAGAAAVSLPVDKILTYHEKRKRADYAELNPHPGVQNMGAVVSYIKYHNLKTQTIASNMRSLVEIEHCSAFDSVCLDDDQVKPAKWHRMRLNEPPGPNSDCVSLAKEEPYPPEFTEDEEELRYLASMPSEARNEVSSILHAGLKEWQDATAGIEDVLRLTVENRINIYKRPLGPPEPELPPQPQPQPFPGSSFPVHRVQHQGMLHRTRSLQHWADSEDRVGGTSKVAFPTKTEDWDDDEVDERMSMYERAADTPEPPSVPQTPYWTDMDSFEDEPGSSSSDEEPADVDDVMLF